ncbi:MAG: hypothetical protein PHZ25_04260, partial [Candidatus Pacebacteria bacterium]|nr:hypothetical protein [Candidatus Paceibacterota bacterium]
MMATVKAVAEIRTLPKINSMESGKVFLLNFAAFLNNQYNKEMKKLESFSPVIQDIADKIKNGEKSFKNKKFALDLGAGNGWA